MKKYNLTIEGKKYEVEVNVEGSIANVKVNNNSYNVEIEQIEEAKVSKISKPAVSKPATAPKQEVKSSAPASASAIKAPLPGNVVKVLVTVGKEVKRGDVLLVMEAMKMENNIMSDKDGIIKAVYVETGRTVALGDALVDIE